MPYLHEMIKLFNFKFYNIIKIKSLQKNIKIKFQKLIQQIAVP